MRIKRHGVIDAETVHNRNRCVQAKNRDCPCRRNKILGCFFSKTQFNITINLYVCMYRRKFVRENSLRCVQDDIISKMKIIIAITEVASSLLQCHSAMLLA